MDAWWTIYSDVADRLAMYLVAAVITEAGYCFSDRNLTKLRPECYLNG